MGELNALLLVKLLLGSAFLLSSVFFFLFEEIIIGALFISFYLGFSGWSKLQMPKLAKSSSLTDLTAVWPPMNK